MNSPSPLNILHVIARMSARDGGPPAVCRNIVAAENALGHRSAIFCTDQVAQDEAPRPPFAIEAGAPIHAFPLGWPQRWIRSPAMGKALAATIPAMDLVVIHSLHLWHGWAAGRCCRRAGVPYIIRPHGLLDPYIYRRHRLIKTVMERLYHRRLMEGAAALHFTCAGERRKSAWYGLDDKAVVMPLGVAGEALATPPPNRDARNRPLKIVFMGRLAAKKGLDVLFAALKRLDAQGIAFTAVIAGGNDGSEATSRQLALEYGIGDRVVWPGFVSGAAKWALLDDGDVFVLPSRSENFAISVFEALARGLAVVVSDGVDTAPELAAADAALITAAGDADALAAALRLLAKTPERRRILGRHGRILVETRHNWSGIARDWEGIYRRILAGEPAQP